MVHQKAMKQAGLQEASISVQASKTKSKVQILHRMNCQNYQLYEMNWDSNFLGHLTPVAVRLSNLLTSPLDSCHGSAVPEPQLITHLFMFAYLVWENASAAKAQLSVLFQKMAKGGNKVNAHFANSVKHF